LTPSKKTRLAAWCATPCGKTRFLPRLAASISNRFGATRGSTPAASVRSTRGKTWRQKPRELAASVLQALRTVLFVSPKPGVLNIEAGVSTGKLNKI
jgi:hypothetical protein